MLISLPSCAVIYEDLLDAESQGGRLQSSCCSKCQDTSSTSGETVESEDEAILRILGIDISSEWLTKAQKDRQKFVEEEVAEMEEVEEETDKEEEDEIFDEAVGGDLIEDEDWDQVAV